MLNQVRKEGCNINIIFILNADQTIRLLKFSDKLVPTLKIIFYKINQTSQDKGFNTYFDK